MPCYINETKKFVLLPDELLILANAHERLEKRRYHQLALAFLPFSPAIGRLMEELARECEQRLEAHTDVLRRLGVSVTSPVKKGQTNESLAPFPRHAHVTSHGQALETLIQAISAADDSLKLWEYLRSANATPELQAMLQSTVRSKRIEVNILQERLDACDAMPWTTSIDSNPYSSVQGRILQSTENRNCWTY